MSEQVSTVAMGCVAALGAAAVGVVLAMFTPSSSSLRRSRSSTVTGRSEDQVSVEGLRGRRPTMEDEHYIDIDNKKRWAICAIFDGHGGRKVSLTLKEILPLALYHALDDGVKDVKATIIKVFKDVDKSLEEYKEQGSTALVAIHDQDKDCVYIAHCGDSRGIVLVGGKLAYESKDHKPDLPEEKARIEKSGGKVLFNRVNADLAVSRAFGDFTHKPTGLSCEPFVSAPICLNGKRACVFLACDGYWDVMNTEETVALLRTEFDRPSVVGTKMDKEDIRATRLLAAQTRRNLRDSTIKRDASFLAHLAIDRGSTDNVSTLVWNIHANNP